MNAIQQKKKGFKSVNKPGVRLKATVHFKGEKFLPCWKKI